MIRAESLVKEFRSYERGTGLRGGLATLFNRSYKSVRAVDAVSFELEEGARTAYIGANGAGKSTTVKMLTGIMTPTSGRCLVNGREPYLNRRRAALDMGVVFGQRSQLWWDLSVPDSFRILRRLYRIPDSVYQRNLRLYREMLDIDALGTTPVRQLSLGQRMRAEIAASLLHDPRVVFWDEPTVGLDLRLKESVRELITHANRELGTTVLLTSHDIGDITAICDRVLVVDRGRVIHRGTVRELAGTATSRSVLFGHQEGLGEEETLTRVRSVLPGSAASVMEDGRFRVDYPSAAFGSREVLSILLEHFEVTDCYAPEPDLESVVREIYGAGTGAV
ncbi:ABC transporter ATP-binding protein [Nocardiopsis halotolerans]|uniref:ABC transporter ATP-binding protein n=1 Tax=Nocardiopsis halotolerans TaxID=124252 RepID=UPI00034A0559|nr:ATP-binding cassette domain-containing protein [Nocardiopsis halotolerans]